MTRTAVAALFFLLNTLPIETRADVIVGDRFGVISYPSSGWTDSQFVHLGTDDVVTGIAVPADYGDIQDTVLGPDGLLYVAAPDGWVARYAPDGSLAEREWVLLDWIGDVAFDAEGRLLASTGAFGTIHHGDIFRIDIASRTVEVVDHRPGGLLIHGLDVPRAGPLENGIVALGLDPVDLTYFLLRYERQADGSYLRTGTFPLPELPSLWDYCLRGAPPRHPTVRRSGLTVLIPEGSCLDEVLEYDLDGNFIRVFAHLEPDPTVLDPRPSDPDRVLDDSITNVHAADGDDVYVSMQRRVYHFDPEGVLIRKVDHLFNKASAFADTEWVPFASAGATCEPKSLGYWKRQCLGSPTAGRGAGGHSAAGRLFERVHPSMRDGRLPPLITRVDARLASYGVTACGALWPAQPRAWRSRALMHYAAVLFNLEDKVLGTRCLANVRGEDVEVGTVLAEIQELLSHDTDASYREAAQLCARLHGGVEEGR